MTLRNDSHERDQRSIKIGFLTEADSLRIDVLRLPLTFGILMIHAYSLQLVVDGAEIGAIHVGTTADTVRYYFSQIISRICVPVFFGLAGYLYYATYEPSLAGYTSKTRSRVRSLLVPFLLWNTALIAVTALAQSNSSTLALFSGARKPVLDWTAFDFFNELVGLTKNPFAYHFWFIRDLIVLVLLAPLIYLVARVPSQAVPLALGAAWLAGLWTASIPRDLAVVFFTFGAWLACNRIRISSLDGLEWPLVTGFLALSVVDGASTSASWNGFLHRGTILIGAAAILPVSRRLAGSFLARQAGWMGPASFFVFASHEPLLTLVKKLGMRVAPLDSDGAIIAFYFSTVMVVFAMCTSMYLALRRLWPSLAALLSGGR